MASKIKTCINSEIGKLNCVLIHHPGSEVENMTPENAERALYSDILNLNVASQEYQQLNGVLDKVTQTFEVKKLLSDILEIDSVKNQLLENICCNENICSLQQKLYPLNSEDLSRQLIEGVVLEKNTLTNYLSNEHFLLPPLHNLFFTRDAAMGMNDKVLIGKMANKVRDREAIIMDAIFNHHPVFETTTINAINPEKGIKAESGITIEGGDFQVASNNIFVIGTGVRTTTQGIDFIIENLKLNNEKTYHIIIQELPSKPESFIHLDMVFTFLDVDTCMVYEPVIYNMNKLRTIHVSIENGEVSKIKDEVNITEALKKLGIDLKPVLCGGIDDSWTQMREQWHSGANFFAFAPGKIIGYQRNNYTIEALNNNGFEVLKAKDIIKGKIHPDDYKKCVVTIEGSELARGGGGARCMTMPISREELNY